MKLRNAPVSSTDDLCRRLAVLVHRLLLITPRNAEAVIGLAETVTAVIELHSTDARGTEAWTKQTAYDHLDHARGHLELRTRLLDRQPTLGTDLVDHARGHLERALGRDEDGLSEASHAATRLAFLLALRPELRA